MAPFASEEAHRTAAAALADRAELVPESLVGCGPCWWARAPGVPCAAPGAATRGRTPVLKVTDAHARIPGRGHRRQAEMPVG